jgi:hypothetical protein
LVVRKKEEEFLSLVDIIKHQSSCRSAAGKIVAQREDRASYSLIPITNIAFGIIFDCRYRHLITAKGSMAT